MLTSLKYFDWNNKAFIYYVACLRIMKPKVIFTFIYTNTAFDRLLSKLKKGPQFVTLQNGCVSWHDHCVNKDRVFQNFLGISQYQADIFQGNNSKVEKSYPVGSIMVSDYKGSGQWIPPSDQSPFDICLISTLIEGITDIKAEAIKLSYSLLARYLSENPNIKGHILLRYNTNKERDFLESIFKTPVTLHVKNEEFDNYKAICQANVTIGLYSTLAMETIELERKILYMNPFNEKGHESVKNWRYTFREQGYNEFSTFLTDYLNLPYSEYHSYLQSDPEYHFNSGGSLSQDKISSFLNKML